MSQYFHFTLGPVQSFISQARRTRDFWAGSFLISWLSGVATQAVLRQNKDNKIIFPDSDPSFINALKSGGQGPQQGNIPNRFKAKVVGDFDARKVTESVKTAWELLAAQIWEGDIEPRLGISPDKFKQSHKVWNRQVENFWDMQWAITATDTAQEQQALEQRKLWRSHTLPEEGGIKCSLMAGWQELSGVGQPGDPYIKSFWKNIRKDREMDFSESERLCAPAYIKRRFIRNHYFENMKGDSSGWKLPASVPSTTALAATPWLNKVLGNCEAEQLEPFYDCAKKLLKGSHDEWDNLPASLEAVIDGDRIKRRVAALDGRVFYEDALLHDEELSKSKESEQLLKRLSQLVDKSGAGRPSPFYALLLMDGDALGKHLSDENKQSVISSALQKFSKDVPGIVKAHDGFLVYAGGDDLLALLPMNQALDCAFEVKTKYQTIFEKIKQEQKLSKEKEFSTTISAAIQYAHFKTPLTKIIHDAHPLLDDKAKKECGRDALAIQVNVPGGVSAYWAGPWAQAAPNGVLEFSVLQEWFDEENNEGISSSFFHRIREIFNMLNTRKIDSKAQVEHTLAFESAQEILLAEYLSSLSGQGKKENIPDLRENIRRLLNICQPKKNGTDGDLSHDLSRPVSADGFLIIRFLASKGRLV